jgi:hypothetical protein
VVKVDEKEVVVVIMKVKSITKCYSQEGYTYGNNDGVSYRGITTLFELLHLFSKIYFLEIMSLQITLSLEIK